jgi:hypothetical protein
MSDLRIVYEMGWLVVSLLRLSSQDKAKELKVQGKIERKSKQTWGIKTSTSIYAAAKDALRSFK